MADTNVVDLPVRTTLDLPPGRVLDAAAREDLETVIVVGLGKDGSIYLGCSTASEPVAVWLLEHAKLDLLTSGEEE